MLSRCRLVMVIIIFQLFPVMAAAQAPAQAPEKAPAAAPQAAPAPQQPQAQPGTCPMLTPEQMKQMQGKMGQCCPIPPDPGSQCKQLQKQIDELQKRVEALEKQQGKKK